MREFFENSIIWEDVKDEIKLWIEDIRDILEDRDKTQFIEDFRRLQGSSEALRNVLNLAEQMIMNKEIEIKEREDGNEY